MFHILYCFLLISKHQLNITYKSSTLQGTITLHIPTTMGVSANSSSSSSCAWKGRKSRAPKQRTLRRPGHGGHGLTRGFVAAWLWSCFTRAMVFCGWWFLERRRNHGISLKGSHVVFCFLLNENGYDMDMM